MCKASTNEGSHSDGNPLPSWLSFNGTTRTFTGTPATGDAGTLNVRVTASDGALTAEDIFELNVVTAFYRALNLNGAALSIDGNNWEASAGASNFSYSQTGGGTFSNQSVALIPSTDADRTTMIRSSIWGNTVSLDVNSVPNGNYDVFLYVWEDNNPVTFSVSVEGVVVVPYHNSGGAGIWSKLGPFRTTIADGNINVSTDGSQANLSGLEIHRASTGDVPVTDVEVSPSNAVLAVGQAYRLSSTVTPTNATDPAIDWSSSNPGIATVDNTGLVRAIATGSATITATSVDGSHTDTSTITVEPAGNNVLSNPEFDNGTNLWTVIDYSGTPSNSIAVVQDAGLSGDNSLYIDIQNSHNGNWSYQVKSILGFRLEVGRIYRISFVAKAESARQISASLRGEGTQNVYWYSTANLTTTPQKFSYLYTNNNAAVDSDPDFSIAFPVAKGVISDIWLDNVRVEDVTDIVAVTNVSVAPTTLSLPIGQTGQLNTTFTPSNATNQDVEWRSSNPAVATVSNTGLVTAVSPGSAVVSVYTANGGYISTSTVTVTGVPVTNVSVSHPTLSLSPGNTFQLVSTITPTNATNQNVNWISDNPAVATVNINNGIVTAVGPGTATITVTTSDGSFTDQSEITVSEPATESSVLEQFAFQYKYDGRRRMTHKKVPGAEWVYMVYDNRDRLVMTQDGNQRNKQPNEPREWTFTKYDELNRPVLTGIYKDTENRDQGVMQQDINEFYVAAENNTDEWFETSGSVVHGYTNQSFPKVGIESDYLTVTYYDDYTFQPLIGGTADDYNYDENQLTASGNEPGQRPEEFIRVQGQVTGSKMKNLDTNEFLWSVNYYDDRYRVIQVIAQNNKGGLDKITNVYDFVGKVLRTKTDHSVTGTIPLAIATTRKLTYDHMGRLLQTEHQTATADPVVLSKNDYNELGQLVTKNLHSEDDINYKQQVDYRYNIRGWLTRINDSNLSAADGGPKDYFGMELGYNDPLGISATEQYNGNISAIKWSTNFGLGLNDSEFDIHEPTALAYGFAYDPMNRLKTSEHFEYTTNVENVMGWLPSTSFHENIEEYDLNGNIKRLRRTGKGGNQMDVLDYSHYIGNQLMKVVDTGNDQEGFKDGNVTGDDYIYDDNGNMVTDRNKNIDTIEYNYLNLPAIVTKDDGQYVKYIYNAAGVKVSQEVYDSSDELKKKTDYLGEFFYENDTLKFVSHEEGRIVMTGTAPEYQYTLRDHLGNTRITFTSKHETETFTATMDPENAEDEQLTFGAYNSYVMEVLDPTPAENAEDNILVLNGSTLSGSNNGQVGLTKSFAVVPGDKISANVNTKYIAGGSGESNLINFASVLTAAFSISPPLPGESNTAFEALNLIGTSIVGGGRIDGEDYPKGFLTILVFDKDYVLVDSTFQQVQATTDFLSREVEIRQPGYVYVFLSNEGATMQQIGFDNYRVTHEHSDVIQQDNYYPFGLTFNSYSRENSVKQKFKFQGQEHIDDLDLGWDSFKWRNHQPDIGRFFNIDPLAEKYVYNSPYAFSENHVTSHIELEGLEKVYFQKGLEGTKGFKRAYNVQRRTSLGKTFTRTLNNKKTHDVFYYELKAPANGFTSEVKNKEEFKEKIEKGGYYKGLQEGDLDKSFADGKKVVLVGVHGTDVAKDDDKSATGAARILNHEEGSHGQDILEGNNNDAHEDHKKYYGENCECPGNISPNADEIQTDAKYKDSPAKKNYDEIDKIIKDESKPTN